jgi:hypothetical protein
MMSELSMTRWWNSGRPIVEWYVEEEEEADQKEVYILLD